MRQSRPAARRPTWNAYHNMVQDGEAPPPDQVGRQANLLSYAGAESPGNVR